METSVELQPLFTFSTWDIVAAIAFVAIAVAALMIALHLKKKVQAPIAAVPQIVFHRPAPSVRARYIAVFDSLSAQVDAGKIDTRECCEQVSENIRKFASEMTGIDLSSSTLDELEDSGMPSISETVAACYGGEFPRIPEKKAHEAIDKAKKAVNTWR